ncbi:MAG: electron transfer flavoprotein subunit alpha/FixB family protein [Deltaproteobacteria bacterium]|nr:electron transfer flavoprotein subunit alpha/FixB family protein [Deltaproteobacteria bacterium]MBW2200106.1 electron transfer flavoprotein subunit alpha/FixB family protein [Deltaproteobacteria bacterium]MBW2538655.1 electron transfer flavoprotein subunit alpha/FixB family protein [Deltaproteobacteria bacterium]
MQSTIVIIAEHIEGKLKAITFELAALALTLQQHKPGVVKAVILGNDMEETALKLSRTTGLDVMGIEVPGLVSYHGEVYKAILSKLLGELQPAYVCIAHTNQGLDFAPGLAVGIDAACITGVEQVFHENKCIYFSRVTYNGKIIATVTAEIEPVVVTLQPGRFKPHFSKNSTAGLVELRTLPYLPQTSRSLGIRPAQTDDAGLAEARVIVSAGRGIGKKENLNLLYRLAELFPKSSVAGSRLVCDMDWLEKQRQVGITGNTVAPELYIACGISGAVQHVAGMGDAGFIVAVNTDPNAAIFNVSDICIVEDLTTFIPEVLAAYKEKKEAKHE